MVAGALDADFAALNTLSVKYFVYTSFTSILLPKPNIEPNVRREDWNIEAIEAAWKPPTYQSERAWAVYAVAKAKAEQTNVGNH